MQEIAAVTARPVVPERFHAVEKRSVTASLLANYAPDMNHVTPAQYQAATRRHSAQVALVFWSCIMIACGSLLLPRWRCADTDLTLA